MKNILTTKTIGVAVRCFIVVLFSLFTLSFYGLQTTYALNILDSDLNNNGIVDSTEVEVIVTTSKSLLAGEYNFNNLIITNNATLTLEGAPLSADTFKGVKINAVNVTITLGSRISSDGKGYSSGPGTLGPGSDAGASYGGVGGGNTATSTYGSATMPTDLGSGAWSGKGGGAIILTVSGTLLNDGGISSNGAGNRASSGGSIYATAQKLSGAGTFSADGIGTYWPYQFAGGGGRIAVYYQQSSFTGSAKANAGTYCLYGCNPAGGAGTVAFFDTTNNDLYVKNSFRFQVNDTPFNFRNIYFTNGGYADTEKGVSITADNISLQTALQFTINDKVTVKSNTLSLVQNSSMSLVGAPVLDILSITIGQGSTLMLSGDELLTSNTVNIQNGGIVTVAKEHTLSLNIPNLNISSGSSISANFKGYGSGFGQGVPATPTAGASYGGVGLWNTATSTYGSSTAPVDFGSGGNGHPSYAQGGGAIKIVSDTLVVDGTISADGGVTASGGSIYVTANNMTGSGSYRANGGGFYWAGQYIGVGGGGRVALYYATSSFSGGVFAKGGCNSFDGWTMTCGGAGTVVVKQVETACQTNCYSNVLFLPGLEASRLYKFDNNGVEDQVWEPNIDNDVKDLFLNNEGKSVRSDIYTKDVIDEKNVLPVGQGNVYLSFLNDLNKWKNTDQIITDYSVTPYDWRLSLNDILSSGKVIPNGISYTQATTSPYIIQELRRLAKSSKTGKVTIVAHSNGGLVAKALLQKLGDTETTKLIDKVVLIAVPQVGTPQALGAILHGYDQGLPFDFAPIILTPQTARTLAENMPSAYNLLPSAKYFTSVFDPVATFEDKPVLAEFRARYGAAINSEYGLRNFITDTWRTASSSVDDLIYPSVGNATLLSQSEIIHSTLDNWTPPQGVSLYEIAGWGEDTLAGIDYTEGNKTICNRVQQSFPFTGSYCVYTVVPAIEYTPREVVDGDGTVLAPSALLITASTVWKYWVNLMKYNKFVPSLFATKHADIIEVPELRALIQGVITNATSTLPTPTFITDYEPVSDVADNRRLSFVLHSPLELSATDNFGNISSFATSTIPGALYTRYGEVQVLKVPKGTPITLNLEGYASGSFTLDVQELDGLNTVVASTTFSAIPSATSTTATISFPDGTLQTATPLLVDYDNNGITDFTLRPSIGKEVIFDTTPPEARISFSTTTQKLLVEDIDETGNTTLQTTATSTLITDESGNTLQLIFKKLKQEKNELNLELQTLVYNGISISTIPKITLQYEWSTDKAGNIKELEQKAIIGTLKVEAHYDAKKNITKIDKKLKLKDEEDDDREMKEEVLSGLRILKLITDKGVVGIDY